MYRVVSSIFLIINLLLGCNTTDLKSVKLEPNVQDGDAPKTDEDNSSTNPVTTGPELEPEQKEKISFDLKLMPAEGGEGKSNNDGASWWHWNKGAHFFWKNEAGDYLDKDLNAQGGTPWSTQEIEDKDKVQEVIWEVSDLVKSWLEKKINNRGFLIKPITGGSMGHIDYATKEHGNESYRPKLIIKTAESGEVTLEALGDTQLSSSSRTVTYGQEVKARVNGSNSRLLVWFDLGAYDGQQLLEARLSLHTTAQYSNSKAIHGLFAVKTGSWDQSPPKEGIAAQYINDKDISNHPDVLTHYSFNSNNDNDGELFFKSNADNRPQNIWPCSTSAPAGLDKNGVISTYGNGIPGFKNNGVGDALCTRLEHEEGKANTQGTGNYGMSLRKYIKDISNSEQIDELYVRVYIFLGETWGENILNESGKRPGGITGTQHTTGYAAGWGGRTTNGSNGWSARGGYNAQIPYGNNPLEGHTMLNTYLYHADQDSGYGDNIPWNLSPNGAIDKGRWYCIEQHIKMNTVDGKNIKGSSGRNDGILRGWIDGRLVIEKTDIRFTDMDYIKIDAADFGLYYGGFGNTPYDQHMAIDDIVISKSYIGPKKDK